MTKLKEMTFAVFAEKENSIAHNWFQQAFSQTINWIPGNWYIYNPNAGLPLTARKGECDCEIKWSEEQFQKTYADAEISFAINQLANKLQDAEKAIEIYKNDVEAKAKRIKALEDVVDDKCREIMSLVKRNIQLSRDFSEKLESQEKIIKNLNQKVNNRDYKINKLLEVVEGKNKKIDQMWCELNNKTDKTWDSLPYSLESIAEAFKGNNDALKFVGTPQKLTEDQKEYLTNEAKKSAIQIPGLFQGVTIEMSVASKILRSKLNLEDDIEIRIV